MVLVGALAGSHVNVMELVLPVGCARDDYLRDLRRGKHRIDVLVELVLDAIMDVSKLVKEEQMDCETDTTTFGRVLSEKKKAA
jgi:hypothetical protein